MGYDRGDSFPFDLNQMEFHLVQNRNENCHHDHIPFNVKGKGNIVCSWSLFAKAGPPFLCSERTPFLFPHKYNGIRSCGQFFVKRKNQTKSVYIHKQKGKFPARSHIPSKIFARNTNHVPCAYWSSCDDLLPYEEYISQYSQIKWNTIAVLDSLLIMNQIEFNSVFEIERKIVPTIIFRSIWRK